MSTKPKGFALLINNDFNGMTDERKGSHVDVANLNKVFKGLGYITWEKPNLNLMVSVIFICKRGLSTFNELYS